MPKSTTDKVKKRRRELTVKRMAGIAPGEANKEIAEEYDVTPRTVENDWSKRDEWMSEVWDFDNMDAFVDQLLAERKKLREEMWMQLSRAKDNNASPEVIRRIAAQIDTMAEKMLKQLQELGRAHKEPDEMTVDLSTVTNESAEVINDVMNEIANGPDDQEAIEADTKE